jgi:hypothetical protein
MMMLPLSMFRYIPCTMEASVELVLNLVSVFSVAVARSVPRGFPHIISCVFLLLISITYQIFWHLMCLLTSHDTLDSN